jgi:hypothetical protein
MTCPYGHDDRSDRGHCLDELLSRLEWLSSQRQARQGRDDLAGIRHSDRHIHKTLQRLSARERDLWEND